MPKQAWKDFGAQGFLCPWLPEEYGGSGVGFEYSVIIAEEMARTNHSGFVTLLHSDIIVPYIYSFGNEEQKKKWLPGCATGDIITAVAMTEPDAGSDLAAMRTTAVKDGDDYVINGAEDLHLQRHQLRPGHRRRQDQSQGRPALRRRVA